MTTNKFIRSGVLAIACAIAAAIGGCEDAPPNDYVPQYVVQGYLLVDEPIRGIVLTRSQPVTDTFHVDRGIIHDADVRLIAGDRTLQLQYRGTEGGSGEYYYPDTSEVVKPNTAYRLEIATSDGGHITAQTFTPGRFSWIAPPRDTISIPLKTDPAYLDPPDSLDLSWTGDAAVAEYLISIRSLDTLDYGKHLVPPTDTKNRRINPDLDEQDIRHYNDLTRWGFIASTSTPIVWAAFKWYGPQEVTLYAADPAMVRWFKMTQWAGNPQYDPLLGNVRGDGIGVLGSASVVRKDVFVVMRDP